MAISVIISNFNGAKYLPRLLDTLQAQRNVELQIIVVDRCSKDESHSILAKFPELTVISERPETGLVAGYDAGVAHARYSNLFFCNEDMWFDLDCLAHLESAICVEKEIWAADPWQWTYDGTIWIHGGTRFSKSPRFIANVPHPYRVNNFTVPLKNGETVAFGCAGAILIDRQMYSKLGGWDRSYFLDKEDVDLFIRAWREGLRCVSVPEAKVYHAVNASNSNTINGGKLLVGKRRYISSCSSQLIMSIKYFSFHWVVFHCVTYILWSMSHLMRLRLQQFNWDMLALLEFCKRLPAAMAFRTATQDERRIKPGEAFFTESSYQLSSE